MKKRTGRVLKLTFVVFALLQCIMHLEEGECVITYMFAPVMHDWNECKILQSVVFIISLQLIEKSYVLEVLAADVY